MNRQGGDGRVDSERLEALFERALELDPQEREGFVALCRQEDAELGEELASLLAALQGHSGFLALPRADGPPSSAEDPWRELVQSLKAHRGSFARYRLHGEVGRGGMGYVLSAFDRELERDVAMKLVDRPAGAGADARSPSASSLGSFFREAKVVAGLDHPGIVPVHELGLDQEGRPYFTMRLVRGRELGEVFDLAREEREGWNLQRALGVVLKVCETIGYAHSKGVLHRDLKPSNVMVGRFGEVYVVDWGLARVASEGAGQSGSTPPAQGRVQNDSVLRLGRRGAFAAETPVSSLGETVAGTPAYMAPEQARGEPIDERSDVYGLGATLYRLLARRDPYVLAGVPLGPEVLIALVATNPPVGVRELAPDVPEELAAICEKAMARDPAQRYDGALALAEDLRAFLEGRVVGAYETGAWAEARKWVRRNRALALALAGALLLAFAGLAGVAWSEARRSRQYEQLSQESQATVDYLTDIFAWTGPLEGGHADMRVSELLAHATGELEARFRDEPAVRARLQSALAVAWLVQGQFQDAKALAEESLDLLRRQGAGKEPEIVDVLVTLARIEREVGPIGEAERLAREAVQIAERSLGSEDLHTFEAWSALASARHAQSDYVEAEELYRRVLSGRSRILGDGHEQTLEVRQSLARVWHDDGRHEEALAELEAALSVARGAHGEEHPALLSLKSTLASVLSTLGRADESESIYRELLAVYERVYGEEHPSTLRAVNNLGSTLRGAGRITEALELFRQSLAAHERFLSPGHEYLVRGRNNVAMCLMAENRFPEARDVLERALADASDTLTPENMALVEVRVNLAMTLMFLGDTEGAEALGSETVAECRRKLGDRHRSTLIAVNNLGRIYLKRQCFAEALPIVEEAHLGHLECFGPDHPYTKIAQQNRVLALLGLGRRAEALPIAEDLVQRTSPEDPAYAQRVKMLRLAGTAAAEGGGVEGSAEPR